MGRYHNLTEAALDQAVLEATGIDAVISTDNAGGMMPLPFAGVIRLMVAEENAEAALEALDGSPDDTGTDQP
ncbi:MAG: hypothetical protein AABZ01_07750 [Gemmatimonadota bacterium]